MRGTTDSFPHLVPDASPGAAGVLAFRSNQSPKKG